MSNDWSKDFYKMSDDLKRCATESVETVLKSQTEKVRNYLQTHTPIDTGELAQSITKEPIRGSVTKVGFTIRYDGYNEHGQAFQVIANSLNRGYFIATTGKYVAPRHFLDEAVSLLRGTDNLINAEWKKRLAERNIN